MKLLQQYLLPTSFFSCATKNSTSLDSLTQSLSSSTKSMTKLSKHRLLPLTLGHDVQPPHLSSARTASHGPQCVMLKIMFMALMLMLLSFPSSIAGEGCLQEKAPKRFSSRSQNLGFNLSTMNIVTSDRLSHRFLNEIFRILAEEYLSYKNLVFVRPKETDVNIFTYIPGEQTRGQPTMLNLEVWMPMNKYFGRVEGQNMNMIDFISHDIVGVMKMYGVFSWYLPTWFLKTVSLSWSEYDCLKFVKSREIINSMNTSQYYEELKFMVSHRLPEVNNNSLNVSEPMEMYGCSKAKGEPWCINDTLYAGNCSMDPYSCIILVSSTYESQGRCLVEQIKRLELNIIVFWIGNELKRFVMEKSRLRIPVLYFGWNIDRLASTGEFSSIHIEPEICEVTRKNYQWSDCYWQSFPIHKFMVKTMRMNQPDLHHLAQNMDFTNGEIRDILRDVDDPSTVTDVACKWLNDNGKVWSNWLPTKNIRTPIYLGAFKVDKDSTEEYFAMEKAANYFNELGDVLPNHKLVVLGYQLGNNFRSLGQTTLHGINHFLENKTCPISGLLSPSHSSITNLITRYMEPIPMALFTYGKTYLTDQEGKSDNKTRYLVRTYPSMKDKAVLLYKFLKQLSWQRIGLMFIEKPSYRGYHEHFKTILTNNKIDPVLTVKVIGYNNRSEISNQLKELKSRNLFINAIFVSNDMAPKFACEIYYEKMTIKQGYVWIFVESLFDKWWSMQESIRFDRFYKPTNPEETTWNEKRPCNSEIASEAVQHDIMLQYVYTGGDNRKQIGNSYIYELINEFQTKAKNTLYMTYAFDTVVTFGYAFDQLLKKDPRGLENLEEEEKLRNFLETINEVNFDGMTGHVAYKNLDRVGIIEIKQIFENISEVVFEYKPLDRSNQPLLTVKNALKWNMPDGAIPIDRPKLEKDRCSLEWLRRLFNVECETALIILNIFIIFIIILIMAGIVVVIKWRFDKKMQKINENNGLEGMKGWELDRNNIILNRKIGQGEFGTVLGGEIKVDDAWTAAAVKTLTYTATSDNKAAFFKEAELMKDFEHENIVRLLGICSRGDPPLVVMEYMLHGDLRSYLLSRRHLVNETSEESFDVSPQAITKMAVDVANGLYYLMNNNCVHRDLACRNCLVHETGTVKIGDFGLTERMFSINYVRCISNGKFPIRWMAPESLKEGVFSSASDIWSFGVLVFEIFTFGTIPYQDMSNEEVVKYVKDGNTITLPDACPADLENFCKTCWSFDPKDRPSIHIIMDRLEHNPLLLVPCLDAPRPQVRFDNGLKNNAIIINFEDPSQSIPAKKLSYQGINSRPFRESSSMSTRTDKVDVFRTTHRQFPTARVFTPGPQKSPDVCPSLSGGGAKHFDFSSIPTMSPDRSDVHEPGLDESQQQLEQPLISKQQSECCSSLSRDETTEQRFNDLASEKRALLCNGCERSSTAPVLHRSISNDQHIPHQKNYAVSKKSNKKYSCGGGGTVVFVDPVDVALKPTSKSAGQFNNNNNNNDNDGGCNDYIDIVSKINDNNNNKHHSKKNRSDASSFNAL